MNFVSNTFIPSTKRIINEYNRMSLVNSPIFNRAGIQNKGVENFRNEILKKEGNFPELLGFTLNIIA